MKMRYSIKFAVMALLCAVAVACGEDKDEPVAAGNGGGSGTTGQETDNYGISETKEVDLGLSVMWSGYNFGATTPEESGAYYAWGETATKSNYVESTYRFNVSGVYNISGTTHDVVSQGMGGEWHTRDKRAAFELYNPIYHL